MDERKLASPQEADARKNSGKISLEEELLRVKEDLLWSERLAQILYRISSAITASPDLDGLFASIHKGLKEVLRADNFFISLIDAQRDRMDFLYSVDENGGACPPALSISDPENKRLTLKVIRDDAALLLSKDDIKRMAASGEIHVHGAIPESWLGVPLNIRGKAIGALVVQDYATPGAYTEREARFLASVADQAAMAIERKQAEDRLSRSQEFTRRLIETANVIFLAMDGEGRIIIFNDAAARITGYRKEEVIGKNWFEKVVPKERYPWVWEASQAGFPRVFENPILTKSGEERIISWQNSDAPENESGVTTVSFGVDVTDSRKYEESLRIAKEQAESSNKAKGEFLATMSHELRTPLNGIMGLLQLLQGTCLSEEQREYVRKALGSSSSLLRLLSDILDLSRIDAGKIRLEEEAFSIAEVVQTVMDALLRKAETKGVKLVIEVDPSIPPSVVGDQYRLLQILLNLAGNSVKFTDSGEIRIEATALPEGGSEGVVAILFSVVDTGIGIADEVLDRVFQRFTQADGSYARKYGGAGLGLAIVERLVKAMGGKLSVGGEPGKGAEFHFSLKLALPQASESVSPSAASPESPPDFVSARILVAEDELVNLFVIVKILETMGCQVHEAHDGQEVLDALESQTFDMVFMDIQMPVMDGIEATRRIRKANAAYADIPIIAMTAYAMAGDKKKFLEAGMNDYIEKPVEAAFLKTAIERALRKEDVSRARSENG